VSSDMMSPEKDNVLRPPGVCRNDGVWVSEADAYSSSMVVL
jgi:hypothetical protein